MGKLFLSISIMILIAFTSVLQAKDHNSYYENKGMQKHLCNNHFRSAPKTDADTYYEHCFYSNPMPGSNNIENPADRFLYEFQQEALNKLYPENMQPAFKQNDRLRIIIPPGESIQGVPIGSELLILLLLSAIYFMLRPQSNFK